MGEETLLIVGNGFDLSMGFKTSYGDFMKSSYFPNRGNFHICAPIFIINMKRIWMDRFSKWTF